MFSHVRVFIVKFRDKIKYRLKDTKKIFLCSNEYIIKNNTGNSVRLIILNAKELATPRAINNRAIIMSATVDFINLPYLPSTKEIRLLGIGTKYKNEK